MNRSGIRHPRLRTAVPAVTALLSLALLTACGGDTDTGSEGGAGDSSAPASASAVSDAKPLTAAELDAASLTKTDLAGYEFVEAPEADISVVEAVEVSDDPCLPVGRTVAGTTVGEADAAAYRRVTGGDSGGGSSEEDFLNLNTGMVTLASYPSADAAAEALTSLGDAVAACAAGGFEVSVGGEELSVTKVTEDTAPEGGEEAVAFTAVTSVDGEDSPWKVLVFRDGATLAHFSLINAGAAVASGEDFPFPADLVTAQADKLA
ncbi:hypothetical protein ACFXAZ_12700 [Streptomyces sp. NPDC059477]|uniref:hypothetical protein n=1 Tax=Streptomyces sp. NPDC059477 TaxID=3346847 RepID=UPI00369B2EDE